MFRAQVNFHLPFLFNLFFENIRLTGTGLDTPSLQEVLLVVYIY